mgnify:CR=1 FL=1
MTIPFQKIKVDRCYQTKGGEVRRVTSITPTGDVTFVSYKINGDGMHSDEETLFAQDAQNEIECP